MTRQRSHAEEGSCYLKKRVKEVSLVRWMAGHQQGVNVEVGAKTFFSPPGMHHIVLFILHVKVKPPLTGCCQGNHRHLPLKDT